MNKKWLYGVSALVLGVALVLGFLTEGDVPDEHAGLADDVWADDVWADDVWADDVWADDVWADDVWADDVWDTPVLDDDASTTASVEDVDETVSGSARPEPEIPVWEEPQVPVQDADQHRVLAFPSSEALNPEEIADAGETRDLQEQAIMDEVRRLEAERADLQASGVVAQDAPLSEAELEVQRQELEQAMREEMRRVEQGDYFNENAPADDVPLPPQPAE